MLAHRRKRGVGLDIRQVTLDIKQATKYILPAALVILLIVLAFRSCSFIDRYSVLKGRYDALVEEYDTQRDNSEAQILSLRNIIAQKDEEIHSITSHIVEKEVEISTLHAETAKLEFTYATLEDKDAKIDNLETQVSIWKQKFHIAEAIISDKDDIIFSLNEKYEAQVKISLEWRAMYENESTLRALAEKRLKLAGRQIGRLKFGGTIKTGLVAGLAGVVVYGLVRK